MKKTLSVVLAALMLLGMLALTACGSKKTPAEESVTAPASDAPTSTAPDAEAEPEDPYAEMYAFYGVESVPDPELALEKYNKLKNGEMMVAFCSYDFSQNMIYEMALSLVDYWTEKGQTAEIFNADGDLTNQSNQIENCGTMGYDLIVLASPSVPGLADACQAVMNNGSMVIIRGGGALDMDSYGFTPTGLETSDYKALGWYCSDMAIAYHKQVMPESDTLKFAFGEFSMVADIIQILDYMKLRVEAETEIDAQVTYIEDEVFTVDAGYTMAENAMIYDPDIRALLSFNDAPAFGMNNYIMQRIDLDPAEFVITAAGASVDSPDLFEMSKTNESVFRGYVGQDYRDQAENLKNVCWNCGMGLVDTVGGYIGYAVVFTESGFGYALGDGGMMLSE